MSHRALIGTIVLFLLSGCSLLPGEESEQSEGETKVAPTLSATPTLQSTPPATESASPQAGLTLNVWMVDEISPRDEVAGGSLLADQLQSFETGHPDLELNVDLKATSGQGGALSYLRSGRNVAPSILPDLIVLPTDQLAQAASEQLIFPLDGAISEEMLDDLFPVADALARFDGEVYGYPLALDGLRHVVFNTRVLTETFPTAFEELLQVEEAGFAFPGAGTSGAELALQFYLAAGGRLADDSNQPILEVEPLVTALSLLNRGRNEGLISTQGINMTSLSETWQLFEDGSANVVVVEALSYFRQRSAVPDSGYAQIPGPGAPLVPRLRGWVWAISTPDPIRRDLAAELITWLASASNLGEWSIERQLLPARRSAFESWPADSPYIGFAMAELERAQPLGVSSSVINAFSSALFDVLTSAKLPQVAAEEAAVSIRP